MDFALTLQLILKLLANSDYDAGGLSLNASDFAQLSTFSRYARRLLLYSIFVFDSRVDGVCSDHLPVLFVSVSSLFYSLDKLLRI